ncbi:putative quinol monooxygenase [Blastococcus sp. SYSU D00669]
MSVVVVATITPSPGEEDAVRDALLRAVPQVHDEPGCELYALHEGKGEFLVVERWASPEALRVHGSAAALTELGAALAGRLTGAPQVRTFTAVPAGDPGKGAV